MRKGNLLLTIISAIITTLAMPEPGLAVFAWFGPALFFLAIRNSRLWVAAAYGAVWSLVYFGIVLWWLSIFGYLPWFFVVFLQSLYIIAFSVAVSRIMPERIGLWGYAAAPCAWTAMQWLRSLGVFGFTWGSFAHTQAEVLPIAQLASITGPWGIDFLVAASNIAVVGLLCRASKRDIMPSVIVLAIAVFVFLWGNVRCNTIPPGDRLSRRVAVVQGNMMQDYSITSDYLGKSFRVYAELSRKASKSGPDLIVWGETAIPSIVSEYGWGALVSRLAQETETGYIIGGCDVSCNPADSRCYNAAFVYSAQGKRIGIYRKVHLVPGGEFVPLREYLPFLQNYKVRPEDLLPGESHEIIETPIGKVGVSVCFESIFPQIARTETLNGASVLVVMTYDAWFKRTPAARQHFNMSKLRAIENKRYLVRAAATGISGVIDPRGHTVAEMGIFRQGIIEARIMPIRDRTIYTLWGDYFAYICAAITVSTLIIFGTRCRESAP